MSTTTFERAKVGDRVYSLRYGEGTITAIQPSCMLMLAVLFDNGTCADFRESGFNNEGQTRDLYYSQPEIIAPEEPKRMKTITTRHRIVMRRGNSLGYYPVAYREDASPEVRNLFGTKVGDVDLGIKEFTFEAPE